MLKKPLYISKKGGTINCFLGDTGWIFRVRTEYLCLYCDDYISAKAQLERLERLRGRSGQISIQAMKREGQALRNLVEAAAAPYLGKDAA